MDDAHHAREVVLHRASFRNRQVRSSRPPIGTEQMNRIDQRLIQFDRWMQSTRITPLRWYFKATAIVFDAIKAIVFDPLGLAVLLTVASIVLATR